MYPLYPHIRLKSVAKVKNKGERNVYYKYILFNLKQKWLMI